MADRYTAIYARQSVDKKESLSIQGQIELCTREAGQVASLQIYQDKGYSGKNVKRPDFSRLMADVEAGHVSKIICYRLDRISRSITDFGYVWEVFERHDVEFVSVNERFDTSTPMGRAMLYIIMVFAQLERETIAERIKDNYYQRVRRGSWPGGRAPFGFSTRSTSKDPCALYPIDTLAHVPAIFQAYASPGASLGAVCRWLKDQGIPRPSGKPTWPAMSLNRVLRHPAYVQADATIYAYYKAKGYIMANDIDEYDGTRGIITVGKSDHYNKALPEADPPLLVLGHHQGVVPAHIFLACQHKLDQNRQLVRTGTGQLTFLSGLLACAKCGYSLNVQKQPGKRRYLICTGRYMVRCCDHRHSEVLDEVEVNVLDAMVKRLHALSSQTLQAPDDIGPIKAQLAAVEDKINNLVAALSEGSALTVQYVNQQIAVLDAQRAALLDKLTVRSWAQPIGMPAITELDLHSLPFDQKKAFAQVLIKRVHIATDAFDIQWNV